MKAKTPSHLWLELKPDYIDANYDQVLDYLKSFRGTNSRDTFYLTTLDLLRQRAQQIVITESTKSIGESENIDFDSDVFHIKLLSLYILTEKGKEGKTYREAFFTLLFCLARCTRDRNVDISGQLVKLALEVMSCKRILNTGLGWDIFNLFSIDMLTHKVLSAHILDDTAEHSVILEKRGTLKASLGKLKVSATNSEILMNRSTDLVPSISLLQDAVQVVDSRSNKIKQSEYNSLRSMEVFTNDFIGRQDEVKPYVRQLSQYTVGELVDVELISKEGPLRVRTIDSNYEPIEGDFTITCEDKLLYYTMDDFRKHLNVGDQFPAVFQSVSKSGHGKFAIDEDFKDYVINVVYKEEHPYATVRAKLMDILTGKNGVQKMLWWTEFGFPAYSDLEGCIEVGHIARIQLSDTGVDRYRYFVNAYFDSLESELESIDEEKTKYDVIRSFTYSQIKDTDNEPKDDSLSENIAKELCRLLYYYQRILRSASDRYRILCTCRIIAELVGDSDASKYICYVADYLEDVVAFADDEYENIKPLEIPDELTGDKGASMRADIVEILMEYGKEDGGGLLDMVIDKADNPLLVRLAKLVQSANRISNVVSDNLLVHIKKEIISNLSIDSEDKTDLEENKGAYYGTEDVTKEFKTSFFEAPDDSKHPQDWNVFREICAFLNSELGGTLYLGVQDNGYALGIKRDMMNLVRIGSRTYPDTIDGYRRYILDDAKKFFSNQAVLMNLTFNALEDGNVLEIRVRPWECGIVEMDGQAFIRMDSESLVMDSQMKDSIIQRKLLSKKGEAGIIKNLMKAMEEKRIVNLHGYASASQTGTRTDIEPFAFDDDYQTVWCYNPKYDECRTYKVSRIGSVEILQDVWRNTAKHRQGQTDIFRMTGEREYNVEMQLDQYAKILLCEEFPKAVDLLCSNSDKTSWYLRTKVRALEGVGRFYIGLGKQHITLVNSPKLEEYVQKYAADNLL